MPTTVNYIHSPALYVRISFISFLPFENKTHKRIHTRIRIQTCFTTAQQDAERAKYIVLGAQQEKQTIITRAKGEAESAILIGQSVKKNPGFMKLRRIDAARDIADIVSASGNKVYLNADSLLLNLLGDADDKFEKSVGKKSKWW
jgi:hypothetical protein